MIGGLNGFLNTNLKKEYTKEQIENLAIDVICLRNKASQLADKLIKMLQWNRKK